ncbi:UNVERIFIED_CONTAM: Cysteine proteinase 3 [Sesamum radiatum]|uniref:Cysteine proteinase 3 n=1 Tax=Sesamum radiatum TaxID=300843 RepID=A0AAW2LDM5_SESRA
MARTLLLVVGVLIVFVAGAQAGSEFLAEENPIRQVVDGLHELETSILRIVGESRRALSFARFAHRYGKRYENAEEIQRRFQVFSENLKMIRSHNKKGLSYTMGVNEFSDMTWDEFRKHRLGAAQNCSATTRGNHKLTDVALPELLLEKFLPNAITILFPIRNMILKWTKLDDDGTAETVQLFFPLLVAESNVLKLKDWRETGIVSPVKNQGHCGSCWTFSTTGALEAAYAQAFGKGISLSEQQLVDCAGAFNNFGCNGGLPSQAFEYIKYNGGLETEDAYPYTGKNGLCKYSSENAAVQVVDSVNITLGAEDELRHAVAFVRPVSVAFEVVNGFRAYKGGVYTSTKCGSSPMDVNHAVLAVGYGVENGIPYWLIKNSWGADWGDNGYFKMEMGKNMCGVATCASYPVVA